MSDEEITIDEEIDCSGKIRRFRIRSYGAPGGEFVDAVELRDDDQPGLRFMMPVPLDGLPPLMELRKKVRQRLAQRDVVRHQERRELHILDDLVRAQITSPADGGSFPDLVLNDLVVSWEDLGRALMTYEGWGLRIEIHSCGDE
ncbi:MAG: hypothetical protein ABIK83_14095 [Candidatus Zixiibacteriota bacterium]